MLYTLLVILLISLTYSLSLLLSNGKLVINIHSEVLASVIGALLGAIGAYTVGLVVEKRTNSKNEADKEQKKIVSHRKTLLGVEIYTQSVITALLKNERLLGGIASTISTGEYTVNSPRVIPPSQNIQHLDIRNMQLLDAWLRMELQLTIVNQIIEDFNDYYKNSAATLRDMALRGQKADQEVAQSTLNFIAGMAKSAHLAVETAIEDSKSVLDITRCLGRLEREPVANSLDTIENILNYHIHDELLHEERKATDRQFGDIFTDV